MTDTFVPPPTPTSCDELLVAHGDHVRRLALALVGRDGDVDDVVQDAWLAALRRPPAERGNLRHWLATIVRNVVRQRHRSATRVRSRERRAAKDEALPSSAELVERADLERRLVEAVLELDEPGRETVLLRYFEGLDARDIAARQRLPVETVRTRLKRALARVRARLDAAPDRGRAWRAFALGLATSPPTTLAAASTSTTAGAAAGLTILTMSTKAQLGVAAGALALATGGVLWIGSSGDEFLPGPVDDVTRTAVRSNEVDRTAALSGAKVVPETPTATGSREAVAAASSEADPANRTELLGRLVGVQPGVPWTSPIELRFRLDGDGIEPREVTCTAHVADDGTFDVRVPEWATGALTDAHERTASVEVRDFHYVHETVDIPADVLRRAGPLEVAVRCACVLQGTVTDTSGAPLQGVTVAAHWFDGARPHRKPVDVDRLSPDARYTLRVPRSGTYVLVAYVERYGGTPMLRRLPAISQQLDRGVDTGLRPGTLRVQAIPGQLIESAPIVLEPTIALSGTVRWLGGEPVANASLEVLVDGAQATVQPEHTPLSWWNDDELAVEELDAACDDDGNYVANGLVRHPTQLRIMSIDGVDAHLEPTTAVIPPARVDVVVDATIVELVVTDGMNTLTESNVGVERGGLMFRRSTDDGRARYVLERGATYTFHAEAPDHLVGRVEFTVPRSARGVVPAEVVLRRLDNCAIAFDLGPDVDTVLLSCKRPNVGRGAKALIFEVESDDGVFRIAELPGPGAWHVTVDRPSKPWHDNWLVRRTFHVEVPSREPRRIADDVTFGGRVRVVCIDDNGRHLGGTCTLVRDDGVRVRTAFRSGGQGGYVLGGPGQLHDTGPNETHRNVYPGDWTVTVNVDGLPPRTERVTVTAGKVSELRFEF